MKTYSRYDFMQPGTSADPITGNAYPDPLSINYLNYFYEAARKEQKENKYSVSEDNIKDFPKTVASVYRIPIYDDIILTLNGYSHKNFIKPGDVISFPDISLIESSLAKDNL